MKKLKPQFYFKAWPRCLILAIFFYFSVFNFVQASVLYLMPQSQTVYQGDTFIAEVRLNTEGEEINVIETNLIFPPNLLEIIDFSRGGSILSLWAKEPAFSNKEGLISFAGGLPGGFKGEGLVLKITFLAKEIGKTNISFEKDSQVLLNDGQGSQASLMLLEGNYEIAKKPKDLPIIFSRTHPDQNKWHNQNTLHLQWNLVEGAQYSYLLSKDPLAKPDNIPDQPEGELIWMGDMEYPNLEDGIYYFSLKQKLLDKDWSEKISFRAMIDITFPEEFTLSIGQDPSMFGGKYFLSFTATDKTSGIDYYEIKEGKQDFKQVSSPYFLVDQSLSREIVVRAYDKAGNKRIAEIIPPEKPFPYLIVILVIIGAGIIWLIIKKRFSKAY